jgi:formylglycine-generating enzyme required for sulfatase activity
MVNWYHAIAFCNRLSILAGLDPVYTIAGISNTNPDAWLHSVVPTANNTTWNNVTVNWNANGYRLPTEAEWEYACRAGTTTTYYTGNTADEALQAAAWYNANTDRTHQIGLKTPNAWGLYDMTGNVWEGVWDWVGDYTSVAKTDPRGPATGPNRGCRGGTWNGGANYGRSAMRGSIIPANRSNNQGFRVVRIAPDP